MSLKEKASNASFVYYNQKKTASKCGCCHHTKWYARITIRPAYSPAAPALGCKEKESNPVMVHNRSPKLLNISWEPFFIKTNCQLTCLFIKTNKLILNVWMKKKTETFSHGNYCNYLITLSLSNWGKRMDISKARPCHWHHFSCCIQFHCTWSQWNHTVAQRKILGLQLMYVSKQFMLGVISIRLKERSGFVLNCQQHKN